MIKNYFRTAIRNLLRHKIYSLINIAGLSVGLALTILLLSFIRYELSYEDFNPKKERIYRTVTKLRVSDSKTIQAPMSTSKVSDWVRNEIPEIESILRMNNRVGDFTYNDEIFRKKIGFKADSTFFTFFNYEFEYGNQHDALKPNGIILSKQLATTIFQGENPLGKTVKWNDTNYEVTGVFKPLPRNTHIEMDFLIPFSSMKSADEYFAKTSGLSIYSYYLFKPGMQSPENRNKLDTFIENKMNEQFSEYGVQVNHRLQNLGDIHLNSEGLQYTLSTPGSKDTIWILSVLAFFIVLIAIINYINLETSRAETRSLEVGIRKVSGANRENLVSQFIGESLITVLISFLIALGLVDVFSGGFENLVNREFSHELYTPLNIAIYFGLALFVSLVAGFYPAIFLSSFRPSTILKKNNKMGKGNSSLRILLVVAQFTIASFLIIGLLMVYSQIQYAKNKDLGFDEEQVLVLKNIRNNMDSKYELVKNQLTSIPSVVEVTGAAAYPGNVNMHNTLRVNEDDKGIIAKDNIVRNGYDETLGLEMVKGRYFSKEFKGDTNSFVLNQRAVEMLGMENPVGKQIYHNNQPVRIIGIMKNYHLESMREEIMPVMHSKRADQLNYVLVKVQLNNLDQTLDKIKEQLASIDQEYVFHYEFLDDHFAAMYDEEERMNKTSLYSAAIAIFIALLGLYALTSFVVLKRRKEIGIRKAMGANVGSVILKLIKDINKWVLLANLIAWPLAYYFIREWLANFAYHIEVSVWYFVAGTLIAFVFALIVISAQAYSAANENPAYTLRDE